MLATECKHGTDVCTTHPEPDSLGRYRCQICHCFTADPDRIHSWCRPKGTNRRDN